MSASPASTRVLLVRHGQSTWNADARWQGQADPPLSALGEQQAVDAARHVAGMDALWSSDLHRARRTAELIGEHLALGVHVEARLRERHAGEWQGCTRDEIEKKGASRFVDVVRSVSGLSIMTYRGRQEIRFRGAAIGSANCPPQYWVDGIPLERGSAEEFTPENVEAIELYASPATTPPQFSTRSPTCGTVVIWSRLPG